ncbi:Origin recognition complex subunit 5 [Verticillium dahliae VDG2]|nr:Origin recognition complex subunit 5 [Verticillium dahliae VDG2]
MLTMMKNFSVAINCPLPAEISIKDVKRGIQRLGGTFHERVLSTTDVLCTSEDRDRDSQQTRLQVGRQGGVTVSLDWLQDSFTAGRFLDPLEYPISQETWALRGEDEENSEKEIEEGSEEESEEESETRRVESSGNIAVLIGLFHFLLMKAVERETESESDAQRMEFIDHINAIFRYLVATLSTAVGENMEGESEADDEESDESEESEEDSEESEEETTLARFDPGRPLYTCGIVVADKSPYMTQAQLEKEVGHLGGVLLFSISKDTTHFVSSRAIYNKLPQAAVSFFPKVSFVNHDWLDACSQQGSLVHVGPYIHDRLDEEESEESEEVDREEDEDKSEESEEEDREEDEDESEESEEEDENESEEEDNPSYDPRERRS